jgi:uncharacterized phage protein (TIGR01671 family)
MRELKFRSWNSKSKTMYYNIDLVQGHSCKDEHYLCYNERDVIMQFTGILDKNGKEIYEGDILYFENDHLERYGVVTWDKYYCRFFQKLIIFFNSPKHPKQVRCVNALSKKIGELAVIGNIYENADLLKSKNHDVSKEINGFKYKTI